MNIDQFNKVIAGALILVTIAAYVVLSLAHVPIPDYVQVISGAIAGYAIHSFGVTTGSTAVLNGVVKSEELLKSGDVQSKVS